MKTAIKKFSSDLRIRVGYGTAFILLLLSYLLTLYANSELPVQAALIDHSNKVIIHLESLLSSVKDAETGMRGYLLMKSPNFLDPYTQSKQRSDSIFATLEAETNADRDQHARLGALQELLDKKYELMDAFLADYARNNYQLTDNAIGRGYFDKEIMNRVRTTVALLQSTERERLKERSAEMQERYYSLNTIIIASLAIALLMAIYGFLTYSRENRARRIADEQVGDYQRQLQERIDQLDKANRELIRIRSIEKFASTGRIARTIAHEVRNPLTNINLAVDQVKADLGPGIGENPALMLEMVSRNSIRINQLITDLLNSTKFTDLVYKRVSINQLLDETLELAMDRVRLNRITVIKDYAENICDIAVDAQRIGIAFLNLIVNAIEAMEPGKGILQISTSGRDGKCTVTITDNGPGMDPETLSKLFEPYYTTKPRGSGLGLTNTQNIILNHNGHIHIDSEKGRGTSFTIVLELA